MAIEDLEKKLYGQKAEEEKISPSLLGLKKVLPKDAAPSEWPKEAPRTGGEPPSSDSLPKFTRFGRWFFWVLIVAAIATLAAGSFYLYEYTRSRKLSLNLNAPTNVFVGAPFIINAEFENGSGQVLEDVKLSFTLPEYAVARDEKEKRVVTKDFGNLDVGAGLKAELPVVIYGKPDSIQRFEVSASYYPSTLGPRTRFEKIGNIDVAVREPAIKLDLTTPQKVLAGENFEIKLEYKNVSDIKFPNARIELSYPPSFNFKSANPKPSLGNNTWSVSDLDKGAGGIIAIQGNLLATEQSFFEIRARIVVDGNLVNDKSASVNIATSPLSLVVGVNGQTNYITSLNDNLRYVLTYQNKSDVGLSDVVIKAKLSGEMFDLATVRGKGFWSSAQNTITWNAANSPELRVIPAGGQGSIEFDVQTRQTYPIRRLADKNFTLKVDAEISSPTVPYYVSADKTVALGRLETKVGGRTVIASKLFYRDPGSDIKNTGPIPPKANFPTTFTVNWLITNYSTDVKNVEVKASLLSGVRFTGKVWSNVSTVPTYNERTGEVSWLIENVSATKGVLGGPVKAVFQVEATPSSNQVGQPMPIMNETRLKATDAFTNLELTSAANPLTTQLSDDSTIVPGQGTVVP